MQTRKGRLVAIMFLAMVPITNATLEISVATNKAVYQLDEMVDISIAVVNSGSTSETLYGGYYFTTYVMDGVYDWANRSGPQVVLEITFLPGELKTWEMSHGFNEMQDYPLTLGTHSVVGGAGFTLLSTPVDFQVVPEPATVLFLSIGTLLIRCKCKS